MAVENAKAEVAALHVKTENLVTKLREAELENEANQARMRDYKASLDTSKGEWCGDGIMSLLVKEIL